jgi:hypothetical protein
MTVAIFRQAPATSLRFGSYLPIRFGNHFARNPLVLDIRIAICKTLALFPELVRCHRNLAGTDDQLFELVLHSSSSPFRSVPRVGVIRTAFKSPSALARALVIDTPDHCHFRKRPCLFNSAGEQQLPRQVIDAARSGDFGPYWRAGLKTAGRPNLCAIIARSCEKSGLAKDIAPIRRTERRIMPTPIRRAMPVRQRRSAVVCQPPVPAGRHA